MPCPSRRSVLQTAATGIGLLGTGCLSSSDANRPTSTRGDTRTPTSTKTDEGATPSWTVDERVDTTPPGTPALEPTGEWPSYRFDAGNTGANPDGTGVRNGTEYWRLNAGGPASVADGALYNIASRDRETRTLTYRDPATASIKTSSNLVEYGVSHPPVVGDGRVFVTTYLEVFCFDAQSGEQLWRGLQMDGIQSRPTVHDERVLVNSGGSKNIGPHLRAFDATSGDELWRYETGSNSDSTPAVADGQAFISSEGGLHAIDIASGEESFIVPSVAAQRSSPVVHDGTVFAVSDDATGEIDEDELVSIDAEDGTERWRVPVGTDSPPVVTNEAVYAFVEDGIAALDRTDGTVQASSFLQARPVALVGDVLYTVRDGRVYALDVANGLDSLWSLTTEEVQVSDEILRAVLHVTPVDGAVYVSASDAFHGIGPTNE